MQYNTYVKLPIGTSGYSLKYGQATMYVTGIPYSYNFYKGSADAVDQAGWTRNGSTGYMSDLLWLSENVSGNSYGWIASPAVYSPANLSTNITVVTKFYSIGSKTMTLYIGATNSPTTTATSTASTTSKSSVNTSSTKDLRTGTVSVTIPTGKKYISINHNNTTGFASYFYLSSYKIEYK